MKNSASRLAMPGLLLATALTLGSPWAQAASDAHKDHAGHANGQATAVPAEAPMVKGQIKKVNKGTGKLTVKHGEIPNLDMPPMTMVFRVKDPAMLDAVKPGDDVMFSVVDENGKMVITRIEAAQP